MYKIYIDKIHSSTFEGVLNDEQLTDDQLAQIGWIRDPEYTTELPVIGEYEVYWFGDVPALNIISLTLFGKTDIKNINLPLLECNTQELINKLEESGLVFTQNT